MVDGPEIRTAVSPAALFGVWDKEVKAAAPPITTTAIPATILVISGIVIAAVPTPVFNVTPVAFEIFLVSES